MASAHQIRCRALRVAYFQRVKRFLLRPPDTYMRALKYDTDRERFRGDVLTWLRCARGAASLRGEHGDRVARDP